MPKDIPNTPDTPNTPHEWNTNEETFLKNYKNRRVTNENPPTQEELEEVDRFRNGVERAIDELNKNKP